MGMPIGSMPPVPAAPFFDMANAARNVRPLYWEMALNTYQAGKPKPIPCSAATAAFMAAATESQEPSEGAS